MGNQVAKKQIHADELFTIIGRMTVENEMLGREIIELRQKIEKLTATDEESKKLKSLK